MNDFKKNKNKKLNNSIKNIKKFVGKKSKTPKSLNQKIVFDKVQKNSKSNWNIKNNLKEKPQTTKAANIKSF